MTRKFLALLACCALLATGCIWSAGAAEPASPAHHHAAGSGAGAQPRAFVASNA